MSKRIGNPWRTAADAPDRQAVIAGNESCTFAALAEMADRIGQALLAYGVGEGQMVSSDIPPSPEMFALALAVLRYGFGLFPVTASFLAASHGPVLVRDSGSRLHLSLGSAAAHAALGTDVVTIDELIATRRQAPPERSTAPRAGYFAYATSGTTGEPTVVVRSRPWYAYQGVAIMERYAAGLEFGPHIMTNLTFHLGTLGPALYALQAGSGIVVSRHNSVGDLLELIDKHSADSLFLSPNLLLDIVDSGRWARRRPRAVLHGGGACPPAIKRRAIELIGDGLREFYGTSEAIISEISAPEWMRHPGSVGRPLPGVRVFIRQGQDDVPAGVPGRILVQRRHVDGGAGADLIDTGDVGYLEDEGYLHVLGRASKLAAEALALLEHQIRCLTNVADVVVMAGAGAAPAGFATSASCHAEVTGETGEVAREIASLAVNSGVSLDIDVRPRGSFPRTPSGKMRIASL